MQLIVFWTKNPEPLMKKLNWFDEHFPNYYFQFTLNDYDRKTEPHIPELRKRTETFIRLSEHIGKEKVIWRFDPLMLTDKISVNNLSDKISSLAEQLKEHTEKLVFSFADIENYRKAKNNLKYAGINFREFTEKEMKKIAKNISDIIKNTNLEAATCAEAINLSKYGISDNKCIDDELIMKLFPNNIKLMQFLGIKNQGTFNFANITSRKNLKDKGQRKECKCIKSKDIGSYNTCNAMCSYCYANNNKHIKNISF